MTPKSAVTLGSSMDASAETVRRLQNRSLLNLSRMGHCAPTIMQTMLDVSGADAQWLVKLTAGLPGGMATLAASAAE